MFNAPNGIDIHVFKSSSVVYLCDDGPRSRVTEKNKVLQTIQPGQWLLSVCWQEFGKGDARWFVVHTIEDIQKAIDTYTGAEHCDVND